MKIRILSPAERDLEEGYHFYESQSSGLGSYFLDSLYSDIDSLAYFEGIHQVVFGYHRQLSKRFPLRCITVSLTMWLWSSPSLITVATQVG